MESKLRDGLSLSNEWEIEQVKPTIFDSLNQEGRRQMRIGGLLLYLLSYLYTNSLLSGSTSLALPLTAGLIALTEFLSRRLEVKTTLPPESQLETRLFLILSLLQGLALSLWNLHPQLESFQILTIHLSLAFYILSRTGWLSQGRLGILAWFDTVQAFVRLPFKHFMAGFHLFFRKNAETEERVETKAGKHSQQLVMLLASLVFAGLLVTFVWSQLSQVSDNFAALFSYLGQQFQDFSRLLATTIDLGVILPRQFLTLPIALYLFGLLAGSLLAKKEQTFSYQDFQETIAPLRVFPTFTAYIIIGSLCLTYALFFLTGVTELSTLLSAGSTAISPQNASTVAVAGFWQLVRVSLLNFAVLGLFYFLARKPLWDQKGTRIATTILFIFATLLALLAGWKLFGIYILLYGPTPLRLLSGWFVLVVLVWCLLTLVRLYKPIHAIRIGIFYALISFTALCYLYPILL